MPPGAKELEHAQARFGQHAGERQNAAGRSNAQSRIERRGRACQDLKAFGRAAHQIVDSSRVAARFFHAGNVRVRGQLRDGSRQQVNARQRGEIVQKDRDGRRIRDGRVMTDERVAGHLRFEKRRRPDQHGIRAVLGGPPGGPHRGPRRFPSRAGNQRPSRRNGFARGDDHAIELDFVYQPCLAVRSEHHEPGERTRDPARERCAQPRDVDFVAIVKRGGNWRVDS